MAMVGDALAGARVLDLYAGSGALGLEALSRGAREAVFVERGRGALAALRANIAALDAGDRAVVRAGEVLRVVRSLGEGAFDLAFADPPYDSDEAERLVRRFVEHPFARALWVEHRSSDPPTWAEPVRSRRYGDTTLSLFTAPGTDTP